MKCLCLSLSSSVSRQTTLSPTSTAMVSVSERVVAIGGGDVARDGFEAARRLGKQAEFFPADMNHAIAR